MHACGASDLTTMLVYGGLQNVSLPGTILQDFWIFDATTRIWQAVHPQPGAFWPGIRMACSSALINEEFYMFSGLGSDFRVSGFVPQPPDLLVFYGNKTWGVASSYAESKRRGLLHPPNIVFGKGAKILDRYFVLYGGLILCDEFVDPVAEIRCASKGLVGVPSNLTWIFDTHLQTWHLYPTTLAAPSPRWLHQMTSLDNILYVYGGASADLNPPYRETPTLNDTCLYQLNLSSVSTTSGIEEAKFSPWTAVSCSSIVKPLLLGALVPVQAAEKSIVLVAGRNTLRVLSTSTFTYTIRTKQWSSVAPNPLTAMPPRGAPMTMGTTSSIFVFGGMNFLTPLNDMWVMNLRSQEWWRLPVIAYPVLRAWAAGVLFQSQLYLIGGYDGSEVLGDIWRVSTKDLGTALPQWEILLPTEGVNVMQMVAHNVRDEFILIFGGTTQTELTNKLYRYTPPTHVKTIHHENASLPWPSPRTSAAAVGDNDLMLVFGGLTSQYDAASRFFHTPLVQALQGGFLCFRGNDRERRGEGEKERQRERERGGCVTREREKGEKEQERDRDR
eukprot:m.261507 g.261507  ORF g.261507 m.261507 type:complete len:557 (-) comp26782_c1_seq16:3-1673(-)